MSLELYNEDDHAIVLDMRSIYMVAPIHLFRQGIFEKLKNILIHSHSRIARQGWSKVSFGLLKPFASPLPQT